MSDRATDIRLDRNSLLSRLLACYPGSLEGELLFRVQLGINPEYTRRNCIRDLYYMEQKQYVVRLSPSTGRPAPDTDWKTARWRLMPVGNEIANRLIHDPAMEL